MLLKSENLHSRKAARITVARGGLFCEHVGSRSLLLAFLWDEAPEHMPDGPKANPDHKEANSRRRIDLHGDEESEGNLDPNRKTPKGLPKPGKKIFNALHRTFPLEFCDRSNITTVTIYYTPFWCISQ